MIVVIQCAARKDSAAGHMVLSDHRPVTFVADPTGAPASPGRHFARPDDRTDSGETWRQALCRYDAEQVGSGNPLNLLPAWQLYAHPAYRQLAAHMGHDRLFILSAGWGLLRSTFPTPNYDITFSASAAAHKRRRKTDQYSDFRQLPEDTTETIVFLGGKDYVPFFCSLTAHVSARRVVIFNSSTPPDAPGCSLRRFETTTRTNWHYECAREIVRGTLRIDD